MKRGSCNSSSLLRKPLMRLSTSCNNRNWMNRSLDQSGEKLFKTGSSISKSSMLRWTWAMIIRTSLRISPADTLLLKRTRHLRKGRFRLKQSGSEFLERGWKELVFCIRIVLRSSKNIVRLLWSCFVWFRVDPVLLSILTSMFGTVMRSGPSIWTTDLNLIFHSFHRCFSERLHLLDRSEWQVLRQGNSHRNA